MGECHRGPLFYVSVAGGHTCAELEQYENGEQFFGPVDINQYKDYLDVVSHVRAALMCR